MIGNDAGAAPTVLAMGASFLDAFVLTNEGLFGVGDNTSSQLMIGAGVDEVHAFTALAPPSDAGVAKLFTGCGYSVGQCYVTAADQAYCWGDNDHGQVGAQRTALSPIVVTPEPVDIPSGRTVRSMSIGSGQTCAVTDDGAVYCWGENDRGESGSAVLGDIHTPVPVAGVAGATQVAAGRAAFTCALAKDAKTLCWGDNSFAQLGSPPPAGGGWSASPAEVHLDW